MFESVQHPVLKAAQREPAGAAGWAAFGPLRVAAVVYGSEDDLAAILSGSVETLRGAGVKVAGLVQHFGKRIGVGKREMRLEVLPGGEMIRLHDQRGSGVQGCILDADALARAAMAFRQATMTCPDLLLASRFGRQEAAGGGMRAEFAEALIARIPMLIPVRRALLPALHEFLGEPCVELPPRRAAILGWVDRLTIRRHAPADGVA